MTDDTILADNTLNCSANPLPNATIAQSYYRRFHLPNYGVTGPYTVTGMTFGIQRADSGADTEQAMKARIRSIPAGAPFVRANMTVRASEDLNIVDGDAGMLKTVAFSQAIAHPNTTDLVLELFEPNGVPQNHVLVFASNQTPEAKTAYWRAPDCTGSEPEPLNSPDWNDFHTHLILYATGDEGPDVDPPNLGVKIPGGQTLAGAFDAGVRAKLSAGEPCDLNVSLLISRKLANRLGIPRLVGSARGALAKAGGKTMAAHFTRKAKHALKDRHSLTLTVRSKATDDAHNTKTVSKSVTL